MLTKVYGSAVFGVDATTITIEVNTGSGIGYHLVGLPDNAIKESNYRIAAALQNNSYLIPGKKITLNMAPADLRKEGSAYDLTLAIGILISTGQIESVQNLEQYVMMGELSLDGSVLPIKGALPIAIQAQKEGFRYILLPLSNAEEAAAVEGINVLGVSHIREVIGHFARGEVIQPTRYAIEDLRAANRLPVPDFAEVRGQEAVKRGLEIAAAGGHNVLLVGPPGSGKSMLAKRMPGILPPMSLQEALETTKIHSVAGRTKDRSGLMTIRPFRSPHHTISDVALVGGGGYPQPGEISLAHNGVLFLDELPEFKRSVLEVMRQPLEDREVTISRARFTVTYPASFMLVASMNPTPGGYFPDEHSPVNNTPAEIRRYMNKLSGPLLDRIDLHVEVFPVAFDKLAEKRNAESSGQIRKRVVQARDIQSKRFAHIPGVHYNAQMAVGAIREYCVLDRSALSILKRAMERLNLSARAYDRILKVARTIADLAGEEHIVTAHLAEAIQYRSLDKLVGGGGEHR